jgi:long-chain fatty acid transport protein
MKKRLLLAGMLLPALTFAGGFQLNVQGIKALAMGGVFTGISSDASTVFYNPGGMCNLSDHNFSLGINVIDPYVSLQTPQTANIDQTSGKGTPFHFYYSGTIFKEKFDNKMKVGFLVNNQFGSSSSFEDDWQGRNIIQNISLKTFMFQPTLSYQVHDKISIGAGLVFASGSFSTEKAVPVSSATNLEGKARLEGSGTGIGYNVGVFSNLLTIGSVDSSHTKISLGASYRSELPVELAGGDATFTDIPSSLVYKFPTSTTFDSKITLPSVLTAGFSVKHIKPKKWSLEFAYDLNMTGWSSYDSLNFDFENIDTPDSKTFQDWENVLTHRFGVDFTLKEKYSLRAGAYYDNTPMKDGFVSPHLPGISQLAWTTGFGYRINDKLAVDVAYLRQDAERETSLDAANFSAKYHRIVNVYSFSINVKVGGGNKEKIEEVAPVPAAE